MLFAVRYGLPAALILIGVAVLLFGGEANLEGWALFTGAGLAVLLLNVLHRTGVAGDRERIREQEARRYFDRHGHWPDEGAADGAVAAPDGAAAEGAECADEGRARPLEQPPRERSDSARYGPPPIEAPPPKLRRPPRRRGE